MTGRIIFSDRTGLYTYERPKGEEKKLSSFVASSLFLYLGNLVVVEANGESIVRWRKSVLRGPLLGNPTNSALVGNSIVIGDRRSDRIVMFNLIRGTVRESKLGPPFSFNTGPSSICGKGEFLWCSSREDGLVSYDFSEGISLGKVIPISLRPTAISIDGGIFTLVCGERVVFLDRAGGGVIGERNLGFEPEHISTTRDSLHLVGGDPSWIRVLRLVDYSSEYSVYRWGREKIRSFLAI